MLEELKWSRDGGFVNTSVYSLVSSDTTSLDFNLGTAVYLSAAGGLNNFEGIQHSTRPYHWSTLHGMGICLQSWKPLSRQIRDHILIDISS